MFPIIRPGSIVQIDQNQRKVVQGKWEDEDHRPIYFLELRGELFAVGARCSTAICMRFLIRSRNGRYGASRIREKRTLWGESSALRCDW